MRKKVLLLLTALLCLLIGAILLINGRHREMNGGAKGLFCWEAPTGENAQWLWDLARRYGIGELYVAFPEHPSAQEEFLRAAQEEGLAVYWLTGDPSWAMEPEGSEMLRQVEQAGALHTAHSETLRGIVFDVEPYLLDEWDEDADALMRSFASAAQCAYERARQLGLEMILCVPYYYDTTGHASALETLISSACDRVAVMNYYREDEARHIETEAAYAQAYGKGLIHIYELQPPGEHGLQAINTYYGLGADALRQSFRALRRAYPQLALDMALHDAEALAEVMDNEYSIHLVDENGAEDPQALAGMAAHDEWALNGPFLDRTLLRNYLCLNVAEGNHGIRAQRALLRIVSQR